MHFAEWNFSAMYLPIEYGKMVFWPLSTESTPSFSSAVLFTQPPGPETSRPIALRKNALVPELVCGSCALIVPAVPPTWFQLVTVQLYMSCSCVAVRVAGAFVVPLAAQVTASLASATKRIPPGPLAG